MSKKLLYFILLAIIKIVYSDNDNEGEGKFLYFAYGSNLLARRLHLNNPSAEFYSIARLQGHRLDFNIFSERWNGTAATIVVDPDETVWGGLWTLNNTDMEHLDEQEGVPSFYFAKNVTVTTPQGVDYVARTYEEVETPSKIPKGEIMPYERRPSNTYLQVIIIGAIELKMPAEYIAFLETFPTNGLLASKEFRDRLGYPFNVTQI